MPITHSPLRYPGGKTKLYKYTKELIRLNNLSGCTYVEPFAGGCGLSLQLLYDNVVSKLVLNDIDTSIYSFWNTVLNNASELCKKIQTTEVTIDEWKLQKNIQNKEDIVTEFELAYSTLFLNRTNRSGIISAGPIGGYEQTGNYTLDCRFNKKDIINKIMKISSNKKKIHFYNLDAEIFIKNIVSRQKQKTFIFLDPPYFAKGPELYTNFYNEDNHTSLRNTTSKINKHWIVTYDNVNKIKELYSDYHIEEYNINYSAQKVYKGKEIMIYSKKIAPIIHPIS